VEKNPDVIQVRMAHQHNIVLREFTSRLSNLTEKVKNGLFDAFSGSTVFGQR